MESDEFTEVRGKIISTHSVHVAAQCWCDDENAKTTMDEELAMSFAIRFDELHGITHKLYKLLKISQELWKDDMFYTDSVHGKEVKLVLEALQKRGVVPQ